jgi:hypothetical protein
MPDNRTRSSFELTMIAGLVATALARPLIMMLDGRFVLPGLIFTTIPLVSIVLVWTCKPILLTLVTAVSALFFVGALRAPLVQSRLAHPESTAYFLVALLELMGGATATLAGFSVLLSQFRARNARSEF